MERKNCKNLSWMEHVDGSHISGFWQVYWIQDNKKAATNGSSGWVWWEVFPEPHALLMDGWGGTMNYRHGLLCYAFFIRRSGSGWNLNYVMTVLVFDIVANITAQNAQVNLHALITNTSPEKRPLGRWHFPYWNGPFSGATIFIFRWYTSPLFFHTPQRKLRYPLKKCCLEDQLFLNFRMVCSIFPLVFVTGSPESVQSHLQSSAWPCWHRATQPRGFWHRSHWRWETHGDFGSFQSSSDVSDMQQHESQKTHL